MTGLKCNVTSCANNEQYQCCLPDIQVAGLDAKECCETCCASFENKSAAKIMQYVMMFQTTHCK